LLHTSLLLRRLPTLPLTLLPGLLLGLLLGLVLSRLLCLLLGLLLGLLLRPHRLRRALHRLTQRARALRTLRLLALRTFRRSSLATLLPRTPLRAGARARLLARCSLIARSLQLALPAASPSLPLRVLSARLAPLRSVTASTPTHRAQAFFILARLFRRPQLQLALLHEPRKLRKLLRHALALFAGHAV
jgi:hypothetical protein